MTTSTKFNFWRSKRTQMLLSGETEAVMTVFMVLKKNEEFL